MRQIISKPILLISLLYLLVASGIFYTYGVKNVHDSTRYLNYAHHLQDGFYVDAHNIWYFGYVLFIFLIQQLSDNQLLIIIMQYLLSYFGVLALYRASWLLHQNQTAGLLTSIGYIAFIDILSWNSYILCESFYCSMICFSLYGLVYMYRSQKVSYYKYLYFGVIFLWTIFTKPSSVALTGACLFSVVLYFYKYLNNNFFKSISLIVLLVGFLLLINKMLTTFKIMEVYGLGEIVFATTRMPFQPALDWVIATVPENIYIPSENHTPLHRLINFIVHNPLYFLKIFFSKFFYFVGHVRPYWSWKHNFFAILVLFPTYFYVFKVFLYRKLTQEVRWFVLLFLGIQVLMIGLTVVDWDGRFLMPVMPVLFLLIGDEIRQDWFKNFV